MTFTERLAAQFRSRCASNQLVTCVQQMQRSGETVQGVIAFSNENVTLEDNTAMLEGDNVMLEDNTTFDERNEDLFPVGEDRFDDNSDDGLDEWHDERSNEDWLYDRDVQCDDPIYNNAIADENGDSFPWSCKARYEVGYKDKACKFSVSATKLPEGGEYWQVWMLHKANGVALRPKDIIGEMRVQWGLEYLYVTAVATDEAERFKYCFWAYRACIWGFRDVIRPTVAIDTTHLKGRFKGVLLVAVCKDANECIYPVAFGIGHVEDEDSWT
ncbi:Uncharacterized protein TCM_010725 [Theobroma cacao]|uniref:MULE transposase domain-containing protein n=1 Tax=Theobroma cacao TaxID=3641 RepID=A0A061E723_THECC|nr:Uncharacterized protein TCM_010725 [Theobroma cacao]